MASSLHTVVSENPAHVCAQRLVSAAVRGAQIAITGGSTPRAAYERAASIGGDWRRATIWFTDERCVPPDHEHSNFAMANASLFTRLGGACPAVHRMRGEEGSQEGAARYAQELRELSDERIPRLDLILLGVGPDGHVASLFPGRPELDVTDSPVVGVAMSGLEPFVPRISLSMPLIIAAREIVFLVTGASKAQAVARAIAGDREIPAARVQPSDGTVTWILDRGAASEIDRAGALA